MANEKTRMIKNAAQFKRDRQSMRYLTERIYNIIKAADVDAHKKAKENWKSTYEARKKSALHKVQELLQTTQRKQLEEAMLDTILCQYPSFTEGRKRPVNGAALRKQCEKIVETKLPTSPSNYAKYACIDGMKERYYFYLAESRDKMQAALDILYFVGDWEVQFFLSSLEKWTPKAP